MQDLTLVVQNDKTVLRYTAFLSVDAIRGLVKFHKITGKYEIHHITYDYRITAHIVHYVNQSGEITGAVWPIMKGA